MTKHSTSMNPLAFIRKYDELFNRLLFLLGALVVYRFGSHVPIPGMDPESLSKFFQTNENTILGLFNMFSGGALERMSVMALGIMPYISASIIVQMMTAVIPSLDALKKEGQAGQRQINKYTRQLTLALALVQSIGMCTGLISQNLTLFLMWLGEQITERGIGNGISMLILAGIIATFPQVVTQSINSVQQGQMNMIALLIFSLLALAVVAGIVFIERAQRRIPVNYAQKQSQERKIYAQQQSHLPLKINMAGVIPAIFASSLLLFPASLGQWVGQSPNPNIFQSFLQNMALVLSPGQPLYLVIFAALIIFFCYFYTALVFSPKEVSENLKRSGAYIPGIRPGLQTQRYLDHVLNRLTFIGAIYMTIICLMPMILQSAFGIPFHLGGTSVLISVVVIMDFIAQVKAHLMTHQYHDYSLIQTMEVKHS